MAELDFYTIARFWSKVAVGRDNQCWPWRGARDRYGYGQFKVASRTPPQRAHRVAYTIVRGERLSSDVHLMHECDRPACCNPAHLHKGDPAANAADKQRKNRTLKGMPLGSRLADIDPALLVPQTDLFR